MISSFGEKSFLHKSYTFGTTPDNSSCVFHRFQNQSSKSIIFHTSYIFQPIYFRQMQFELTSVQDGYKAIKVFRYPGRGIR